MGFLSKFDKTPKVKVYYVKEQSNESLWRECLLSWKTGHLSLIRWSGWKILKREQVLSSKRLTKVGFFPVRSWVALPTEPSIQRG